MILSPLCKTILDYNFYKQEEQEINVGLLGIGKTWYGPPDIRLEDDCNCVTTSRNLDK